MISNRVIALIVLIVTVLVLHPNIEILDQHGDEKQYIWKAHYFAHRLVRLDFSPGTDLFLDPGFDPMSYWAWDQPYGSNLIYALSMGITQTPPPELPYSYNDPATLQGPETDIPPKTLLATRFAAVLCAALGLALLTLRFGWISAVAAVILLAFPATRDSFSRAWAEGPLMLGFGLCAAAWKTRWFPIALGAAIAFKLTALALWWLVFLPGSCGPEFRWRRILAFFTVPTVLSIMTPASWFFGGPAFLVVLVYNRIIAWMTQSAVIPAAHGFFFPPRYAWPLELAAMLLAGYFIQSRVAHRKIIPGY